MERIPTTRVAICMEGDALVVTEIPRFIRCYGQTAASAVGEPGRYHPRPRDKAETFISLAPVSFSAVAKIPCKPTYFFWSARPHPVAV